MRGLTKYVESIGLAGIVGIDGTSSMYEGIHVKLVKDDIGTDVKYVLCDGQNHPLAFFSTTTKNIRSHLPNQQWENEGNEEFVWLELTHPAKRYRILHHKVPNIIFTITLEDDWSQWPRREVRFDSNGDLMIPEKITGIDSVLVGADKQEIIDDDDDES